MNHFSISPLPDVIFRGRGVLLAGALLFALGPAARSDEQPKAGELRSFKLNTFGGDVDSVAFSPDGKRGLFANGDGNVSLWDLDPPRDVRRFVGHEHPLLRAVFSSDGTLA